MEQKHNAAQRETGCLKRVLMEYWNPSQQGRKVQAYKDFVAFVKPKFGFVWGHFLSEVSLAVADE